MLNKLSLLGNCFISSCTSCTSCIASSASSVCSSTFSSTCCCISGTGCYFSSVCCFFSGTFSYNSVVSLFCTCRKSRNSKSKAAGYSEHFAEVGFGSHLKYPLWMN